MADFTSKAPGVYVEEITPAGPIAGSGTSIPAFIGVVAAPVADPDLGVPVPVTNWNAFVDRLGGYKAGLPLPHAVRGWFANGGTFAYVVPVKDDSGFDAALTNLTRFKDVSLVACPGTVDPAVQSKVLVHCETEGDRFAVLDGVQDQDPLKDKGPLRSQRTALVSKSGFGALYWPWVVVADPLAPAGSGATVTVPPSGHVAGVMARVDDTQGVHKAPANEVLRGVVAVERAVNDVEQGQLNGLNINVLRSFPTSPPLVWGARTLTDGTPWRYVNVRRLVSYVEDSLVDGLRWAVFQPNNLQLWKGVERSVSEFLERVWRSGALFGATAGEAFYVTVDETNNPEPTRALGQLFVEIGLAVTRPAEFVVLRVGLWDGGATITEA